MDFKEYIIWRLQLIVRYFHPCDTCRNPLGDCRKCDKWHNGYKKNWQMVG